jgi:hypothetical protein
MLQSGNGRKSWSSLRRKMNVHQARRIAANIAKLPELLSRK